MKVHEAIATYIADQGIDTCFGVMGEANMYVTHDLVTNHDLRYVGAAREDGAVSMADAYTRLTGRTGLATVTHGPGLTNTITALTEAARNGTPMVLLTGETPAAARNHVQAIDQQALVRATGAAFHPVRSADTAVTDVALALRDAQTQGCPAVVSLPSDLQHEQAGPTFESVVVDLPQPLTQPDEAALDHAVGIIASARRPLLIAGRGAATPEARAAVERLAERLGAPIGTTLMAKDLFRDHPRGVGVVGTLASEAAGQAMAAADCIIAIGASLNQFTTGFGSLLSDKVVVHGDRTPEHIGRWQPVDAAIVGGATEIANAIEHYLAVLDAEPTPFWGPFLAEFGSFEPLGSNYEDESTAETVDIRTFARRVDLLLPSPRVLVTDGGRSVIAPMCQLSVDHPDDFVFTLNFAAVGLGMGAAVGAAFARPNMPCVLVTGDGGLMMELAEFSTAVKFGLDLIVLVMNDASYGAEYHNLRKVGMDPALSMLDWPDLAPIAETLGGIGVTVRSLADIEPAMKAVQDRDRPVLVDVKLDVAVRTGFYD